MVDIHRLWRVVDAPEAVVFQRQILLSIAKLVSETCFHYPLGSFMFSCWNVYLYFMFKSSICVAGFFMHVIIIFWINFTDLPNKYKNLPWGFWNDSDLPYFCWQYQFTPSVSWTLETWRKVQDMLMSGWPYFQYTSTNYKALNPSIVFNVNHIFLQSTIYIEHIKSNSFWDKVTRF